MGEPMTTCVYVGNFVGVSHSTETHYARAFEANGCQVYRLQENDPASWPEVVPDLFLYTRTWDTPEVRPAIEAMKGRGVPTVAVHLDVWRGLNRDREVETQAMFRCDWLFQTDGAAIDWFADRGVRAVWLPAGVVADECYVAEPLPNFDYDVAFVGSYGYHAEWPHRPALIDHLRERYGDRFVHVGSEGWPGDGLATRNDQLNRVYASVPVIVGDSIFASRDSLYWSDRVYETLGRGGLLVMPTIDALMEQMEVRSGGAVALGSWGDPFDWDTLDAHVDALVESTRDPEARRALVGHTVEYVRDHHSYTQRAATILATVLG